MLNDYSRRLAAARARVREISAQGLDPGTVTLIDVREPDELAVGLLPGAVSIPMARLMTAIETVAPDPDTPIVLYCAVGERSAVAAA